ncbi:MAG: hypothetical protein ACK5BL_08700 [Flavobacteriales bacterium]|jgi:hypothetical protein
MELVPFSVINEYLKEKLLHPSRYSRPRFSFLKIFQHGLYFHFTKQKHKILFNYLRFPLVFQQLVYWLKSKRKTKNNKKHTLNEYVILDPGRVILGNDQQWHSIYFDRIASLIGPEKVTVISQREDTKNKADFTLKELTSHLPALDSTELSLLREVNLSLQSAIRSKQFSSSELNQIRSAMHIFFEEFRGYYHVLKNQPTKKLLFICHYHNEGLIAATKCLGIECIEFQHGLIASNDLYYVYHEQFASVIGKSFFPEKILVYGPYWKRILENGCEYHSHQIHVAGDYLYRLPENTIESIEKENMVLVCAQKNMHDDYTSYVRTLMKHVSHHTEWKVIVKLHPLEKNKDAYYALSDLGVEIRDIESPLDVLLKRCKIHISIYSTTFYDALGYDVCNFSLQHYGSMSDYAADMIAESVALPLFEEDDPIAKFLSITEQNIPFTTRDDVYSSFNEGVISKAIGLS